MGSSLLQVLTYDGWPTKEDWTKWEAWWDKEVSAVNADSSRRGQKGVTVDWHFKVKRLADLIASAFEEMMTIMLENFTQWSVEKWSWRINLIKNALIEINILPWPIPNQDNWFTRINNAGK